MNKHQRYGVLAITISLLAALIAIPVLAAAPLAIHIEVPATINQTEPDPFTASGPAVDAGAVCASGLSEDLSVVIASNPPGGNTRILRVLKRFTCGDGTGTFDLSMTVQLDLVTYETTALWRIIGGTGDYAGLRGNGSLVGTPIVPGSSILDVYDGMVR